MKRIRKLTCGRCAQTQRLEFNIVDGQEIVPECPKCGPTTWLAFPSIPEPTMYDLQDPFRTGRQSQPEMDPRYRPYDWDDE